MLFCSSDEEFAHPSVNKKMAGSTGTDGGTTTSGETTASNSTGSTSTANLGNPPSSSGTF